MAHSYAPGGGDIKSKNTYLASCTTAPKMIEATERRAKLMEWRRERYLSFRELAEKAKEYWGEDNLPKGYDHRYAWQDVRKALDITIEELWFNTGQFVAEELLRLGEMNQYLYQLRENNPDDDFKLKCIDRMLKVQQRKAKMLGLDKPQKMEVSHKYIDVVDEKKKLDALKRIGEVLQSKHGERGKELLGRLVDVKDAKLVKGSTTSASERETGTGSEKG